MKTYNFVYVLLALLFFGCSKSDNGTGTGNDDNPGVDASYNLLVTKDGLLSSILVNATAEVTTLNPAASPFEDMAVPDLMYKEGSVLTSYHKDTACSGKLSNFDFTDDSSTEMSVFEDLSDCELNVTAVAHSNSMYYLTYQENDTSDYFIRVIDPSVSDSNFTDVPLKAEAHHPTYVPKEMVYANDRLFVLTHDEEATDEYHLLVMEGATNVLIHDINLGFSVHQIFRNPVDNIIVSYDNLHTELNSTTMAVEYTNYGSGTEPHFTNSKYNHFDPEGLMYYEMEPGSLSTYPVIPAVYNFKDELAILYLYENFLTEAERNFEFEIESTTMVCYDQKNGLILIGYKKIGSTDKGGLMRVKPAPEPAFIDNLDVDGVPFKLFVK